MYFIPMKLPYFLNFKARKESLRQKERSTTNKLLLSTSCIILGSAGSGKTNLLEDLLLSAIDNNESFLLIKNHSLPRKVNNLLKDIREVYFIFQGKTKIKADSHSLEVCDVLSNKNFWFNTALKNYTPYDKEKFFNEWLKLIAGIVSWEKLIKDCSDEKLIEINFLDDFMKTALLELKYFFNFLKELMEDKILKQEADISLKNINNDIRIIATFNYCNGNTQAEIMREVLMTFFENRNQGIIAIDDYYLKDRIFNNNIKYLITNSQKMRLYSLKNYQNIIMKCEDPYNSINNYDGNSLEILSFYNIPLINIKELNVGCFIVLNKFNNLVHSKNFKIPYIISDYINSEFKYENYLNSKEKVNQEYSFKLQSLLLEKSVKQQKSIKI